jgi:hypothetical protein
MANKGKIAIGLCKIVPKIVGQENEQIYMDMVN